MASSNGQNPSARYGFGTFKGVFTPSLLTILGVIMYLRFPWILGSVGVTSTIVIVTMSVAITLLTGLSISATATNMKVGGGGAYYLISRTLGVEVGAAVGLPLFLAQALGVAFYIVGFSETVVSFYPWMSMPVVGIATLMVITGLAYYSADLALKSQYVILTILALSLVSLFAASGEVAPAVSAGEALPPAGFWIAFAVFFPAVTGIEAGLGMSGDLKNPARALPRGTLAAVVVSYLVYLAIPIFLNRVVDDSSVLLGDTLILTRIARWPMLVILGILGATLSSALGALLGAPRTLQALANDAVVPGFIGRGYGASQDPRLATVVAFIIAVLGILMGDLNAIAPVLSMFFLTSYAVLNLSAGIEGLIGSPAWRPSFRVPWWLSMLGAAGCLGAMLMISAGATIVAVFVSVLVFHGVQRRQLASRWGDVRYGALVLIARFALQALARRRPDARSWNPNLLVFAGMPSSRWHLVELARALAGDSGLVSLAMVVPETVAAQEDRISSIRRAVEKYLKEHEVPALVKIQTDASVTDGMISLVKAYGFGPIVPNTVIIGKSAMPDDPARHAQLLALVQRQKRNLVVVHEAESISVLERARRIDLWWRGQRNNLGLMLAMTFLLQKDPVWSRAKIVVRRLVKKDTEVASASAHLIDQLERARFDATVEVFAETGDPLTAIAHHSHDADLLFLGLRPKLAEENFDQYGEYYADLARRTEGMPPTLLVASAEDVDLHRLFAE